MRDWRVHDTGKKVTLIINQSKLWVCVCVFYA